MLFHNDNAPAHTSAVATVKLVELDYELQPHSPYSPDLAKCCGNINNEKQYGKNSSFYSPVQLMYEPKWIVLIYEK